MHASPQESCVILAIFGTFLFFRHVDNSNPYPFDSLCSWFSFGYYFSQPTLLFLLQIPSLLLYMIRAFYTFLIFESCLYLSVLFCFCDMLMTLILTSLIHFYVLIDDFSILFISAFCVSKFILSLLVWTFIFYFKVCFHI